MKKYGRSDTNAIKTNQGNELSNEIFKTLTFLIEHCPKNEKLLNDIQLRILLGYCEEDLLNNSDYNRKQSAFKILQILLDKRIERQAPEFHEVMKVVLELSIKSFSETVRLRARTVFMNYLNTVGILKLKKINGLVDKLIENSQRFEHEYGRESAFLMIGMLPEKLFVDNSEHLLLSLSLAITKESNFNKSYTAAMEAYKKLLLVNKLTEKNSKFSLRYSEIVLDAWMKTEKTHIVGLNSLIILAGLESCNDENDDFKKSKIVNKLTNVIMRKYDNDQTSQARLKLTKIFYGKCGNINSLENWIVKNYREFIENSSPEIKLLISEIIGLLLSKHPEICTPDVIDASDFVRNVGLESEDNYNPILKSISTQCLKNIIGLTKINGITVKIAKSMTEMTRFEAANCPKETSKRTAFMKFLAAVVDEKIDREIIIELLNPLQREIQNTDNKQTSEELRQISKEVVDYLKTKTLGEAKFAEFYGEACRRSSEKKYEREMKLSLEVANNPELLSARKIKRNEKTRNKRVSKLKKEIDAVKMKKRKMVLDELDNL